MSRNAFTLDEDELPDVSARLTPRPDGGSAATGRRSLNGTWQFTAGDAEEPPDDRGDWRRHDVPGQWNTEGYEVAAGERGWYRREFAVPAGWSGRVGIRFDAVNADAVVLVNGERVGTHDGGYTPFEVDVTDAVRAGDDNVLAVGVAEGSTADELAQVSLGGGITRGVTLLGVPDCHLADLDVETALAEDGERATVRVRATVANAGDDRVADAAWRIALTDPDGDGAGGVERDVGPLDAGAERDVAVEIDLDEFVTWDPERPRLYDLACDLRVGDAHERVERRVGIRQIEVDGDRLLLNGRSVTLRGVNWRESHPDHGQAVPPEITRRDAERLREANVNYVRTGHHPTSEAFVEACDELGIVVEMEAPVAFLRFENSHLSVDPDYRDAICRQVLGIVERDKNRTSVCLWSLSNESDWGPNFEAAARLVSAADPTRPITFNWGMHRDEDVPFCDVANHHYPALRDSKVDLDHFDGHDRPVLFDEFAHLYCYNGGELGADPGLRDDYVRVLERCLERVREIDACAGVAIWAGLDHLTPEYRWGVIDRYRRPRPEYWHVKKAYAPVRLASEEWRDDGTVRVELENRAEFVNLSERHVEWTAGDESGRLDVDAAPGGTATASIPAPADADGIALQVRHPRGFTINEFVLRRADLPERRPAGEATDPTITEGEHEIRVETASGTLTVDRNIGEVEIAGPDGEPVVSGLPALVASSKEGGISIPPEYGSAIGHRLNPWRCEEVRVAGDAAVEIRGGYYYDTMDVAEGSFVFRLRDDGELDVEYDFTLDGGRTVRETGVALPVAPDCETLSWSRDGRWSTYPADHIGRRAGTATPFPGGERPADEAARLDRTRPWAADATSHGSNDFRSTKRDVRRARLDAPDGRGIEVRADGDRHVRCSVQDDAIDLLVLDRSLAGSGLGLLDRHALLDEEPHLDAGTRLRGTATIRVRSDPE